MNDIVISASNLSKKYRLYDSPQHRLKEALHPFRKKYHQEFWALRDIFFEAKKGETIGIIGKNGSGKSTLLQIVCGVLQASEGTIAVNGKISALLELGTGFNPEFTGRQNVYMSSALVGLSRKEVDARFDDIANFADIGEFIDQPVKTYSSGMYVRLAFATAINVDPDILIVDEALSVGDMFFQTKCMKKIKQLMENGCTTLFVSHDMSAVKSLCARAVYLDAGIVKSIGDSGDVCTLYISDQRERSGLFRSAPARGRSGTDVRSPVAVVPASEVEEEFGKRVAQFRKGIGDVRFVYASLFDENSNEIIEADFGQRLTFKAIYRSRIALPELVFAFYVKDKNQLEIIGTNNVYERGKIEDIEPGKTYSVEFSFINQLRAGNYSITALLADSTDTTEYHDWIGGVVVFRSHDLPGEKRWALVNPPMKFKQSLVGRGDEQDGG